MLEVKRENTMRNLLALIVLVCMMVACAPKNFSPSEKAMFTTVRSLQAAKQLRVTGLKAVGDMYIAGTLTDPDFKADVIRVGDLLQETINVTSKALEIYYTAKTEHAFADLQAKVSLYQQVLGEFTDLVMPYVLEHLGDE